MGILTNENTNIRMETITVKIRTFFTNAGEQQQEVEIDGEWYSLTKQKAEEEYSSTPIVSRKVYV